MATDDFAILTCISSYADPSYPTIDGPPNDLLLVKDWLMSPQGGGLIEENIKIVKTPQPYPTSIDPDEAPPIPAEFDLHFKKIMRSRLALGAERVKNRLYLYFSGHGFCNRSLDRPAEAALYCANASREFYEHIFGTQYARVAQGRALFKEIVLIMDCCRDSEIARVPRAASYRDTPDDELAAGVLLLSVYAVPKGGKAQERAIGERGNKVYGLLTHAILKLLEELPASSQNAISSSELKQQLLQNWQAICGTDSAPRPEVYVPASGDIFLNTKGRGSLITFKLPPATLGATLEIFDPSFRSIAVFDLSNRTKNPIPDGAALVSFERIETELRLRMRMGLYQYRVNVPAKTDTFKVDGSNGYIQL